MHLPLYGALSPLTMPRKGPSSLLTGLVAYWKLDEASGQRDDTVGSNHLTDVNTVSSAAGKIGSAASHAAASLERLDSVNDLKQTGDFTFAAWFNETTTGNTSWGRGLVSYHTAGDQIGDWWVSVRHTGAIYVVQCKSAGTDPTGLHQTSTTPVATGSFQHVVAQSAGGVYTIWHNGASQGMNAASDKSSGWNQSAFSVGTAWAAGAQASYYWDGLIDEAGLWNRALTDAEIADLYNSGNGRTHPFS